MPMRHTWCMLQYYINRFLLLNHSCEVCRGCFSPQLALLADRNRSHLRRSGRSCYSRCPYAAYCSSSAPCMGVGHYCSHLALQQLHGEWPLLAYPWPHASALVPILIFAFSRCSFPMLLGVSIVVALEVIAHRAGSADSPIRAGGVAARRSFLGSCPGCRSCSSSLWRWHLSTLC